jgi:hypothetical protein
LETATENGTVAKRLHRVQRLIVGPGLDYAIACRLGSPTALDIREGDRYELPRRALTAGLPRDAWLGLGSDLLRHMSAVFQYQVVLVQDRKRDGSVQLAHLRIEAHRRRHFSIRSHAKIHRAFDPVMKRTILCEHGAPFSDGKRLGSVERDDLHVTLSPDRHTVITHTAEPSRRVDD